MGTAVRLFTVALLVAALTACGWTLRGSGGASLDGRGVQVVDNAGSSALRRSVERSVEGAGGRVVDQAREDDLVITLYGEGDSQRTLSVGSDGEVTENEVTYNFQYSVSDARGETVLSRQRMQSSRAYPKDNPEQARRRRQELVEELREDAVRLMLLRVQIL